jgi:MFS superfamily sulfate permease-like transporter
MVLQLASLRHDLLASVVVFLVALPLCMGIAIASGMPPAAGLLTGIIGGLIVAPLSGCPLQVSGPAAGLTVVIYDIVHRSDLGPGMVGVILVVSGAAQAAAGLLRLGQWFRAVSPAVIHGMLAGIGLVILAGQFHVMLDHSPEANGFKNFWTIPAAVADVVARAVANDPDDHPHEVAALIGLLTIAVLVLWPLAQRLARTAPVKAIPATLVAILLATVVAQFAEEPIKYVAMPDDLLGSVRLPSSEAFFRVGDRSVLIAALTIALVASAETLLCASAVDRMHAGPRTRYDRELFAQGVGNSLCGLVGALPMTGVIVRSAANVEAGGRTRLSATLHGAWLLLLVLLAPGLLRLVPTSALAAVLVYTGYRLVDPRHVRELLHYGKGEAAIYFATLATIVVTDLLTGVLLGVALAVAKLLWTFSHLTVRVVAEPAQRRTVLYLEGAATFLRLPQLAKALEQVPANTELHVHFEKLSFIDHACLDALMTWEKRQEATGNNLVLDWDSLAARFHSPRHGAGNAMDNGESTAREVVGVDY